MRSQTGTLLEAGRAALAARDWPRALELLREADATGALDADDVERLAEAAFWSGHLDECIAARDRSYRGFVDRGDVRSAALVALNLSFNHAGRGAVAVAGGWLENANALLDGVPECSEHGWLAFISAVVASDLFGDLEEALRHAERALEVARAVGDRDVETLGRLAKGVALVQLGRMEEGLSLLDHAMASAVSGVVGPLASAATYCGTISTCAAVGDYRRAAEWIEAVQRGAATSRTCEFPGDCRVHRAEILESRGEWAEAEVEAARACDELANWDQAHVAVGLYELGMVSLRRGDVIGAHGAFFQVDELGGSSQPGRALVELARGRPETAWASLREALDGERNLLGRARLLPPATEAALGVRDVEAARRCAEELASIAVTYPTDTQRARAAYAGGRVASAVRDFELARETLAEAGRLWKQVGASYEEARAREALAQVLGAIGEADTAALQLQSARETYERLGAKLDTTRVNDALGQAERQSRVTRTFMFTDIEDSTVLLAELGDDRWNDVLRWHDSTLRRLFAHFEGQEIRQRGGGDGFFVAFRSASAALECAIAIEMAMTEHRRDDHPTLRVRIGAHEAEAIRAADDYSGRGVHEAARIAALAQGGEILASTRTLESAGPHHRASRTWSAQLKGLQDPVEVSSVVF